jgi:hypothetical protein
MFTGMWASCTNGETRNAQLTSSEIVFLAKPLVIQLEATSSFCGKRRLLTRS